MPDIRTGRPTRISAYTPPTAVTTKTASPTRLDLRDYGPVTLVGTVKRAGDPTNVPLRRRVRLYDEIGRRLMRETWSDAATGAFTFENLPQGRFTAMTYDHENIYRALVIDNLMEVVSG